MIRLGNTLIIPLFAQIEVFFTDRELYYIYLNLLCDLLHRCAKLFKFRIIISLPICFEIPALLSCEREKSAEYKFKIDVDITFNFPIPDLLDLVPNHV